MSKRIGLLMMALVLAIAWVGISFVQSLRPTAPIASQGSAAATTPLAGVNAPVADFALNDVNGKVHHLTDYKGKIVALVFYATW